MLATDLDTRFLESLADPTIEVRQHDIVRDSLPGPVFDLVHARLILVHLPERELGLANMAGALKPGGWLVVSRQSTHVEVEERTRQHGVHLS